MAVLTAQFKVGVPRERALVRLYDTIFSQSRLAAAGARRRRAAHQAEGHRRRPDRHAHAVDARTRARGAFDLERVAHARRSRAEARSRNARSHTIGGPGRVVRVLLDPERLAAFRLTATDIRARLQLANAAQPSGELVADNREVAGRDRDRILRIASDVAATRRRGVDGNAGLHDRCGARRRRAAAAGALRVARHRAAGRAQRHRAGGEHPAVTIAVTKKPGENAVEVARRVMRASRAAQGTVDPGRRERRGHAQLRRDRRTTRR